MRGSGGAVALSCGRSKQRRQGRAERQRVEGGDDGRDGDRQGELPEELTGDAGDERARHEDRAQHQADRDHRPGHLVHGLERRFRGVQAVFDVMLDRLDHDDGVVHHDADGQHQAEQRQVVEAEARPWP